MIFIIKVVNNFIMGLKYEEQNSFVPLIWISKYIYIYIYIF
jgi:hypothetical protein